MGANVMPFAPQGLVQDVAPYAAPLATYTQMRNMRTTGDGVTRARGVQQFAGALLGPPRWGMAAIRQAEVWMVYAGPSGVFVTNGVSHYPITPAAGFTSFALGAGTGGLLNDWACFNFQNSVPWYWDRNIVADSCKPLPGWLGAGVRARVLAAFGSHLFAGSISDTAQRFERLAWSDAAATGLVPASWIPTATNQAGELDLSTGAGPINAMRGLGQQLMVYRLTGCFSVQYVGRPYIYTARPVSASAGAASTNAVAEAKGSHVILSQGDIVLADGTNIRSIGEGRVKSTIFSQLSEAGLRLSHCYATPGQGEVVFCLALGSDTECNTAYVWNYERDVWSLRDLPAVVHSFNTYIPSETSPNTWDTDAGTWDADFRVWDASASGGFVPRPLGLSERRGEAYLLEVGDSDADGVTVRGSVERLGIPIGDGASVKWIDRVYPRISGQPGDVLQITLGGQIGAGDSVLWSPAVAYVIGETDSIAARVVGRFLSIRVEGSNAAPWSVSGFEIEFDVRGRT